MKVCPAWPGQAPRPLWISYTDGPGGKDHLPSDVRTEVERQEAARKDRQGRLLCEVHVRVYERDVEDAEMYVSFPADAILGLETGPGEIAAAVACARDQLGRWR
jgi:hypothetical protein